MRVASLGTGIMGTPMIDGKFPSSFPLELAAKDGAAAEAAGLRLPALTAVAEQIRRAAEAGHGEQDMSAMILAGRPA
jgi:3-hydroxyisobutyrate dehydrogenase